VRSWRYYAITISAVWTLLMAHIIASAIIRKSEIDQIWREQEETEVPLWAQQSDGLAI
jgi:hypothetical protein